MNPDQNYRSCCLPEQQWKLPLVTGSNTVTSDVGDGITSAVALDDNATTTAATSNDVDVANQGDDGDSRNNDEQSRPTASWLDAEPAELTKDLALPQNEPLSNEVTGSFMADSCREYADELAFSGRADEKEGGMWEYRDVRGSFESTGSLSLEEAESTGCLSLEEAKSHDLSRNAVLYDTLNDAESVVSEPFSIFSSSVVADADLGLLEPFGVRY